jgi:SPP1 family predicted phage head-tail adaptor
MEVGKLRTPVDLLRKVTTREADGHPSKAYLVYATVRAEIRSNPRGEVSPGMITAGQVAHVFRIRWRKDLRNTDRLQFRGRIFELNAYADPENGKSRFLDLVATEIQ